MAGGLDAVRPAPAERRTPAPAADRAASGRWARLGPTALAFFLVLLALPPRLLETDRFVTTDELFWVGRAAAFGRAIETGQLAQTFQTGHPGVTTMWTAWLGMGPALARELAPSRREVSRREVSQSPAFMPGLAAARRAFGLVTALGTGLLGLLAWRLFGPWPALLGGSLLALDPFFLAHSRLVHIDASLTLWISLALLAALCRWHGAGAWSLVLAGVATGLALLSKSPALILLGLVPLSGVAATIGALRPAVDAPRPAANAGAHGSDGVDRSGRPRASRFGAAGPVARDLAIWALLAAATFVLCWPAVWGAPAETLTRFLGFVRDNANPDHAAAADGDGAGLLFYPLVFLLRSTPLLWLGLAGLLLPPWRWPGGRSVPVLLAYVGAFGAAMTVAAKGFDRYLLPIFPVLDLLAGLGLWRIAAVAADRWTPAGSPAPAHGSGDRVGRRRALSGPRRGLAAGGLLLAVVLGGAWWIVGSWPYGLTYANPLLGGNPAAHRLIASGWGEGLDEAARYLNERNPSGRLRAALPGEIYTTVLDAQLNGTVAPAEGYDAGAYDALVVYIRNAQLGERPPFFDDELLAWVPDHTVTLNGVAYAWVYGTRAGAPVGAAYGGALALDGYGLDAAAQRAGRRLEIRLRWRALRPLPAGLELVAELRPGDGGRPFAVTLPLEPAGDPSRWPVEQRTSASYQVSLDPSMPPGEYVLALRVVGADGSSLPVTAQPLRPPGVPSEADAVPLRRIQVR